MAAVVDAVRASEEDIQATVARSCQTWSSYAEKANAQSAFQPDCVRLQNMLAGVPAFLGNELVRKQDDLRFKLAHFGQGRSKSSLYVNGLSRWRVSGGDCDLREKVMHHQLLRGVQSSTRCGFARDSSFAHWSGVQGERESNVRGNYLAILSFAWAYITSALWVEL